MDEYRVTWLEQRIGILEGREQDLLKRIVNLEQQVANQALELLKRIVSLEQQVANQALELHKWTSPITLKSQAAQQQATEALYAPLRSDTKPLLEMAAFVRVVAAIDPDHASYSMYSVMREIVAQAREILKRST
jgi:cell division septum initiation protein DivIVA